MSPNRTLHPAVDRIPDYLAPFTAYRIWNWDSEGLKSLNNAVWTPGEAFEATCPRHAQAHDEMQQVAPHVSASAFAKLFPHSVPEEHCTCGMYAAINLKHLIEIEYAGRGIHGEVSLWGKLIQHSLGWRAQFAYPKFFIVPQGMIPFNMKEAHERLASLIKFNVDIYLQADPDSQSHTVTALENKIPLWIKDYGWSQQGVGHLVDLRKKWYESRPMVRSVQIGDRVAIVDDLNRSPLSGLSISVHEEFDNIFLHLWGKKVYRAERKNVKWNHQNWRWEVSNTCVILTHVAGINF